MAAPELVVGIKRVDEQHDVLLQMVTDLLVAMNRAAPATELAPQLESLQSSVVEHFRTEEDYMVQTRFEGYEAHKARHDSFVKSFVALKQTLTAAGSTPAGTKKVQKQVVDWLAGHITTYDLEMARFLSSSGIR